MNVLNYLQAFISVPLVVTVFPRQSGSQGHNQEVYRVGDDHIVVHGADDVHNQDGESSAWRKKKPTHRDIQAM